MFFCKQLDFILQTMKISLEISYIIFSFQISFIIEKFTLGTKYELNIFETNIIIPIHEREQDSNLYPVSAGYEPNELRFNNFVSYKTSPLV